MTTLAAAVLIGSGSSILLWNYFPRSASTENADIKVEKKFRHALSTKRRASLLEAVGLVYGTDQNLAQIARVQIFATAILTLLALIFVTSAPSLTTVAAAIPLVLLGWKGPLIAARSKENRRRISVDIELVDALGEMVMGVEAGLTLDVVMMRYAVNRDTSLADEFRRFLDRLQLGSSRADELIDFARRTPTQTMRNFSAALLQNQKLGTPLGAVLRQQATTARRQRRQAIEAKAAKIPLKMIFPTVFCILPVLMIVVVGPSIIRLIDVLP